MEEDIQNHSPTVIFRGTPCTTRLKIRMKFLDNLKIRKHLANKLRTSCSLISQSLKGYCCESEMPFYKLRVS